MHLLYSVDDRKTLVRHHAVAVASWSCYHIHSVYVPPGSYGRNEQLIYRVLYLFHWIFNDFLIFFHHFIILLLKSNPGSLALSTDLKLGSDRNCGFRLII